MVDLPNPMLPDRRTLNQSRIDLLSSASLDRRQLCRSRLAQAFAESMDDSDDDAFVASILSDMDEDIEK